MSADPLKYFRIEAREIVEGLGLGLLALERGAPQKETMAALLRHAHTLKGAARIVRQLKISDLSHQLEDLLMPERDRDRPLAAEKITTLLQVIDQIRSLVDELDSGQKSKEEKTEGKIDSDDARFTSARIDIVDMDRLLSDVSELGIYVDGLAEDLRLLSQSVGTANALADQAAQLDSNRLAPEFKSRVLTRFLASAEDHRNALRGIAETLQRKVERASRDIVRVRENVHDLRMLPASTIFSLLERSVRDAAQSLGKSVRMEVSGGDHQLDAHVLRAIRDALIHIVRNSVAHGIEKEGERSKAGKSTTGLISLKVERRGRRIAFSCTDNGRGLDIESIKRVAIMQGQIANGDAFTMDDAIAVLQKGRFSTAHAIDQLSGRGIGFDVVKQIVSKLNAELSISSRASSGTTVTIVAPLSIESLLSLSVSAGGRSLALPLDSVKQAVRLREEDIVHKADGEAIVLDGVTLPFLRMNQLMGQKLLSSAAKGAQTAVVLRTGGSSAAFGVDKLLGISNLIVRPLPELVGPANLFLGASSDAEGNPQLVLDPTTLLAVAHKLAQVMRAELSKEKPTILVVDDSMTTRMLEQSILETAGYDVELAESAEEALRKAYQRDYSMFLVDVEMPGMSGFDFVAATKADARIRSTPSILVTSRSDADDRRRGEEAGASGYMIKSEFDEKKLLSIIHNLIG